MRNIFLILVIAVFQAKALDSYSQNTRLTLNLKDAPVRSVLENIENNSEFFFLFNAKLIDAERKVSIDVRDTRISDILASVFSGTNVSYLVYDRKIVLAPGELKGLEESIQQNKISGKVTDAESGEPVPGANILVKGTQTGTYTDAAGNYSLSADRNGTLVFTFIGYTSQEIAIGGRSIVDVVLVPEVKGLNEVVVIGYGTAKKESLTSSITSVRTDLLENRPTVKLSSGLQGITPGVFVRNQTGRPGFGATTFDIRGASMGTFSSNPPLIIIDGIVDDINNVNPEDVENISILKDASAAAIYGSRATGGVVLITTKRGLSGTPTINYAVKAGYQTRPSNDYKYISTAEWMRANNEAARNDGSPEIYTPADIAKYENSTDPQYPAYSQWNWFDKRAFQQTHDLNIKGGTETLNFYGSAGYTDQNGYVDADNYKRYNFLLNLNYKPGKRLEIATKISYIKENITRPIGTMWDLMRSCLFMPPTFPFLMTNGDYNNDTWSGYNLKYIWTEGGNHLVNNNYLRMGLNAKYNIVGGLSLRIMTAANMVFTDANNLNKRIPYRRVDGTVYGYNIPMVNVNESWTKSTYFNNQVLLEYAKQWNNHSLTVLGGFTSEDQRSDYIYGSANKFPNNEIREISGTTGTADQITANSNASDWALASVIGRIAYNYKNKYLLESNFRYDGSSRFSPDQRWGFFPSVSAGWRISEEKYIQDNIKLISNLKLRASYGELGNQGSTLYPFAQSINTTGRYPFGGGLTATASMGSPVYLGLSWEKKKTTNIGLDYGLFKNKLTGSFDYFYDRTSDIIGRPLVPSTFGASAPIQNTYVIDNKGWEFEFRWTSNIDKFQYYAGFNIFDSRDKVVSLGGIGTTDARFGTGLVQIDSWAGKYMAEGKPRNSLYLYKTNGLFVNQNEIDNHAFISTLTRPGDIAFIDTNNDGKLTNADMVPDKRTTTPHFIYGINLGVQYKNFDLSTILNGVGERWDYRGGGVIGGSYLFGNRTTLALLENNYKTRWTAENPDKWADNPRLTQNNWISGPYSTMFCDPNDFMLRNYMYLRGKNIQLGYTLPKALVQKVSISNVRIYFSVENYFTITPGYKELIDPESNNYWTEDGSSYYAPPRVTTFGLNVSF